VIDELADGVVGAVDLVVLGGEGGREWRRRVGKGVEEMWAGVSRRTFRNSLHALN